MFVGSRAGQGYRQIRCAGGGLIRHDVSASPKQILIAGTSGGFGQADHQLTKGVCAAFYGTVYDVQVPLPSTVLRA